ncbi:MAG: hypothetical protein P8N76_11800 [Pirellulaceae bacterium]|nr:hypothetical protein [Pirellulaceae bacterium]
MADRLDWCHWWIHRQTSNAAHQAFFVSSGTSVGCLGEGSRKSVNKHHWAFLPYGRRQFGLVTTFVIDLPHSFPAAKAAVSWHHQAERIERGTVFSRQHSGWHQIGLLRLTLLYFSQSIRSPREIKKSDFSARLSDRCR